MDLGMHQGMHLGMHLGVHRRLDRRVHLIEGLKMNMAQVGLLSLFARVSSQFQGTVASIPGNPFTDSHAIATLTSVSVNDLDGVEMTTYQSEDTGGWL